MTLRARHAAVTDWQERGLLDAPTAQALRADIGPVPAGRSFSDIVVLLAVICLGFATMTFVAANWDAMTRAARFATLGSTTMAFWGAALGAQARGNPWVAEALVLGACASFGATLMFEGQAYHIQGPPSGATLLWSVGTLFAAAATRSVPALCLGIGLTLLHAFMFTNLFSRSYTVELTYLPLTLAAGVIAFWLRSRAAAHLIAVSLVAWWVVNVLTYVFSLDITGPMLVSLFAPFPLIAGLLLSDSGLRLLRGFERPGIAYVAIGYFLLYLIWFGATRLSQFVLPVGTVLGVVGGTFFLGVVSGLFAYRSGSSNRYDILIGLALQVAGLPLLLSFLGADDWGDISGIVLLVAVAVTLFAVPVWLLRMGRRLDYAPLFWVGGLGFAVALVWLYAETLGTLLGTAAFYFLAGVVLLAGVLAARYPQRRRATR